MKCRVSLKLGRPYLETKIRMPARHLNVRAVRRKRRQRRCCGCVLPTEGVSLREVIFAGRAVMQTLKSSSFLYKPRFAHDGRYLT